MLIGITGYAGSGKDSIANYVSKSTALRVATHSFYTRMGFADKIKCNLSDLYNVHYRFFNDRTLKNQPLVALDGNTPREAAQKYGMACRAIVPDTWTDYVLRYAKSQGCIHPPRDPDAYHQHLIIPDVRFHNEHQAILAHGGVLLGVYRPDHEVHNHESEKCIEELCSKATHVFQNTSTLEELYPEVLSWFTTNFKHGA